MFIHIVRMALLVRTAAWGVAYGENTTEYWYMRLDCQGRRETRPKGGATHCHRVLRGEIVRGGRDEAGGGVSRKRREGVARARFPAGGDAQVRSSSPCFARGCG